MVFPSSGSGGAGIKQTTRVGKAVIGINPIGLTWLTTQQTEPITKADAAGQRAILKQQALAAIRADAVLRSMARRAVEAASRSDALARTINRRGVEPVGHLDADARTLIAYQTDTKTAASDANGRALARAQTTFQVLSDPNGPTDYRENLSQNPGVEDYPVSPGLPTNWTNNTGSSTDKSLETTIVHSGLNAMKLTSPTGTETSANSTFTLIAGVPYYWEGWYRSSGTVGEAPSLQLVQDIPFSQSVGGGTQATTATWTKVSGTYIPKFTSQHRFRVGVSGIAGSVAYFDDFIISSIAWRTLIRSGTATTNTSDAAARFLAHVQTDANTHSDAATRNLARVLIETVSHADATARNASRSQTTSDSHTDDPSTRSVGHPSTAVATHLDDAARSLAAPTTTVDAHADAVQKNFLDYFAAVTKTASDALGPRTFSRRPTESSTHLDIDTRNILLPQTEVHAASDASVRTLAQSLLEALGHVDAAAKNVLRALPTQQSSHDDALTRNVSHVAATEATTHTDAAAVRSLAAPATSTDTHADDAALRAIAKGQTDVAAHADSTARALARAQTSVEAHADAGLKNVIHYLQSEVYSHADALQKNILDYFATVTKSESDALGPRSLTRKPTEPIIHLDADARTHVHPQTEVHAAADAVSKNVARNLLNVAGHADDPNVKAISRSLASAAAHADVTSIDYMVNGSFAGSNANFSGLTYSATEDYDGVGGAGLKTSGSTTVTSNANIPVDPTGNYRISYAIRMVDENGQPGVWRHYGGLAPLDRRFRTIWPWYVMWTAGTTTTLAAQLNPGDTTITLTSSANWQNSVSAGSEHTRNINFYPYTDEDGVTYEDYGYSRLASNDMSDFGNNGAWANGGITGNVITLRAPWPGPAYASGTKVANSLSGGNYMYAAAGSVVVPTAWTIYTGLITGQAPLGSNDPNKFWRGTAYVNALWLLNRNGTGNATTALDAVKFEALNLPAIRTLAHPQTAAQTTDDAASKYATRSTTSIEAHADAVSKNIARNLLSSATHADDPNTKSILRSSTSSSSHSDVIVRNQSRALANIVTNVDDLTKSLTRYLQETRSLTEATTLRALARMPIEPITRLDADARNLVIPSIAAATLADGAARVLAHAQTDASLHADAASRNLARNLASILANSDDPATRSLAHLAVTILTHVDNAATRSLSAPATSASSHADNAAIRSISRVLREAITNLDADSRNIVHILQEAILHVDAAVKNLIHYYAAPEVIYHDDLDQNDGFAYDGDGADFGPSGGGSIPEGYTNDSSGADTDFGGVNSGGNWLGDGNTSLLDATHLTRSLARRITQVSSRGNDDELRSLVRQFIEPVGHIDADERIYWPAFTEHVTHSDATARTLSRQHTEATSKTDTVLRTMARAAVEGLSRGDVLQRTIARQALIVDAHLDALTRNMMHTSTSATSAADEAQRTICRALLSQVVNVDVDVRTIAYAATTTATHSDDAARSLTRLQTATASNADTVQRNLARYLVSTKELADNDAVRAMARIGTEATTTLDTDQRTIVKPQTEASSHADAAAQRSMVHPQTQVAPKTDSVLRTLAHRAIENLTHGDEGQRNIARQAIAVEAYLDAIDSRSLAHGGTTVRSAADDTQRNLCRALLSQVVRLDADVRNLIAYQTDQLAHSDAALRTLAKFQVDSASHNGDTATRAIARALTQQKQHVDDAQRNLARQATEPLVNLDTDQRNVLLAALNILSHAEDPVVRAVSRAGTELHQASVDQAFRTLLKTMQATAGHSDTDALRSLVRYHSEQAVRGDTAAIRSLVTPGTARADLTDEATRSLARTTTAAKTGSDEASRSLARRTTATRDSADDALRTLARGFIEAIDNLDADHRIFWPTTTEHIAHSDDAIRSITRLALSTKTNVDAVLRTLSRIALDTRVLDDVQALRAFTRNLLDQTVNLDVDQRTIVSPKTTNLDHADLIIRNLVRSGLDTAIHADGLSRLISRAELAGVVRDGDGAVRSLAHGLTTALDHMDARDATSEHLDRTLLAGTLDDVLWFLNMWQPHVFGPLINQLHDEFAQGTGSVARFKDLLDDLEWFRNQWLPHIYGAFLADLDAAYTQTPV